MEKEDLIKGEIYTYGNNRTDFIFVHDNFNGGGPNTTLQWIYIPDNDYHEFSTGFTSTFSKIHEATAFEKQWLNECIKEKRFIPKEQIKEYKITENNYEIY